MKLPRPGFPLQGHQSVVQTVFLHQFLMRTVLFHNAHPAVIDLDLVWRSLLLLVAVRHVHVIVVQFNFGKHRVHGNFSGPRPFLRFHSLPV